MIKNKRKIIAVSLLTAMLAAVTLAGCNKTDGDVSSLIKESPDSVSSEEVLDLNIDDLFSEEGLLEDEALEGGYVEKTEGYFSYYDMGGSAALVGYYGADEVVKIPDEIANLPVTSVDLNMFSDSETKVVTIPKGVENIDTTVYFSLLESVEVDSDNANFSSSNGVLFDKNKTTLLYYPGAKSGDYTVPDTVKEIADNAFLSNGNLKTLTLSKSLENIHMMAIYGCSSLKEIKLADGNANFTVSDGVLYSKDGTVLELYPPAKEGDIKLSDKVKSIAPYACVSATAMTDLKFPDSVETIGEGAFMECQNIKSIDFGKGVKSIGANAFSLCMSIEALSLPSTIESIDENAFASCGSITSVSIDSANKNYKAVDGVLYTSDMSQIVIFPPKKSGEFTVPDGVKSITLDNLYLSEDLTAVNISKSVEQIDEYAFSSCNSLKSIKVDSENTTYSDDNGILCDKSKKEIIAIPPMFEGKLTIPESVENISSSSFEYMNGITEFSVDKNNQSYSSQDGILYNKEKTTLVKCPKSKSGSVTIPDTVSEISGNAFYESGINELVVPEGVESIGFNALSYSKIKKIELPKSLKSIEYFAFFECSDLKDISYKGTKDEWNEIIIDDGNYCFDEVKIHFGDEI